MDQTNLLQVLGRRLRLAIIGGGEGSGIGDVHRIASRLDGIYELKAGVFSTDSGRSKSFGHKLGLDAERSYGSWEEFLAREAALQDRVDVVAVMTPNDSHFTICCACLKAGMDIICDKPLTTTLNSALEIAKIAILSKRTVAVAYCYSGYPMVREAMSLVRSGKLGRIRQIHVQYVQGWATGETVPTWKSEPRRIGASAVLMDIGTHAYHLASFVTGEDASSVIADIAYTVPNSTMDDYGAVLIRFRSGARGSIWVTSAAAGAEHGLMFKVFGDEGGLEWHQETPNCLIQMPKNGFATSITRRKSPALSQDALKVIRTEIGHPEGYLEAFANIYGDLARHIILREKEGSQPAATLSFPTAIDGARGLAFVEAAVESSSNGRWVNIADISGFV